MFGNQHSYLKALKARAPGIVKNVLYWGVGQLTETDIIDTLLENLSDDPID